MRRFEFSENSFQNVFLKWKLEKNHSNLELEQIQPGTLNATVLIRLPDQGHELRTSEDAVFADLHFL